MANISIPIGQSTCLDMTKHTIYVMGFSSTSQKMLSVDGNTGIASFTKITDATGTLNTYKLMTEITEISVDMTPSAADPTKPAEPVDGARIYFFVAENSKFPSAPVVKYNNYGKDVINVQNPPNPNVPPYTFAEFTIVDLNYGAVIDSQTVDGFVFPVNITLNDSLGAVGQPMYISRKEVLSAFGSFMTALGTDADSFVDLQYTENKGGLLNPGAYLGETTTTNEFKNLTSPLNTMFDDDLNTLFSNNNLSIQGVSKGSIAADVYTSTSGEQPLPNSSFSQQALTFTGKTNGKSFHVFNPVGLCVLTSGSGSSTAPIIGTINTRTLTFENPLPAGTPIVEGMWASGAGIPAKMISVKTINKNGSNAITSVELQMDLGQPGNNTPYKFSATQGTWPATSYKGTINSTTLTFENALAAGTVKKGEYVQGAGVPGNVTVDEVTTNGSGEITAVNLIIDLLQPAPKSQYYFSKLNDMFYTSGNMVFANQGVFAFAPGLSKDESTVCLNLQNQLVSALNRGVANLSPTSGDDGYSTKYWGTQANWYPAGAKQNLFSLFMHTAKTTGVSPTPIFIQASDSVACARGTTMGQAYGFAYDENAGPVPPAPTGQPEVPSKFDPVPSGTTTINIALGPWDAIPM